MCGLRVGTGVLPLMCVFDPGEPLLTMAECLSPCKPFFRSVSSSPHAAAISPASIVHHHHQYIYMCVCLEERYLTQLSNGTNSSSVMTMRIPKKRAEGFPGLDLNSG